MSENIVFKCVEITQPIGSFYVGAIHSADLVAIGYADVMRIKDKEDDFDRYLGIQRELSPRRVEELETYVKTIDATFPTSIILCLSSKHANFISENMEMVIEKKDGVAKIIDGQHRIAGLKALGAGNGFQVNVTVFIDMDIEDQALVFSTVNLKQTKVSKSLAYNLLQYATNRSPQKACHEIAKLLNFRTDSPFHNHIKILGKATGKKEEAITQAAFVERLMAYISKKPIEDRDCILRNKKLTPTKEKDLKKLIFRDLFIAEKEAVIARTVSNFFSVVANKWPNAWGIPRTGNILNKTTGFIALMWFLRRSYNHIGKRDQVIEMLDFENIFNKITLQEDGFTPIQFPPGGIGERKLYRVLCEQAGLM